jgi:type VI secretion system protein ImpE
MTAKQLLDQGRLAEAIARLEDDIAARPDDLAARTFLFELLGFAGELDRAGRQLDEIEVRDRRPEAQTGVQAYRALLRAERARALLFDEGIPPRFFSPPPAAIELHLDAVRLVREGRAEEARAALDRVPPPGRSRRGTASGVAVESIRDADDLLAPVLEVITAEGYYWAPWDEVQFLLVPPPQNLRDLLWAPARLATNEGMLGEVYLPNLYPASHRHPDEAVRLGRVTVWDDVGPGIIRGAGQKMFLVGDEPRTLTEIGEVQFLPEAAGDAGPGLELEGIS